MHMEGKSLRFTGPSGAPAGIEIVHQDLALCNNLTAAANVFLGHELRRGFGPFRIWTTPRCTGGPAVFLG
jgi:simple sugar transport system ATP-binding protein